MFAKISSHRPVPGLLTFIWSSASALYHSAVVFVAATTSSTSCTKHRLRQPVTASFEVVSLQITTAKALLRLSTVGCLPIIGTSNWSGRKSSHSLSRCCGLLTQGQSTHMADSPEMQVLSFSVPPSPILRDRGSLHRAGLFSS